MFLFFKVNQFYVKKGLLKKNRTNKTINKKKQKKKHNNSQYCVIKWICFSSKNADMCTQSFRFPINMKNASFEPYSI